MELSSRKEQILSAVVESYISSGEPIGSKALLSETGLSVSSATVRNELADLAVKGYLTQPHTSAGRIPSHLGYRYYLDNLMQMQGVSVRVKEYIRKSVLSSADAPEKILQ